MKRLEIKNVNWAEVTLHLGLGSTKDIEVEDLSKHRMDAEEMHLTPETADIINKAKESGHKICCVGASTMRSLETAVTVPGKISPYDGWTNKFIYPPYDFTIADMLITSFHHSMSSQYIMACAFADPDFMAEAYQIAIKEKYRFCTYGDAMLIL